MKRLFCKKTTLKEAKNQANQEVNEFRAKKEREFQNLNATSSTSQADIESVKAEADRDIKTIKAAFDSNRENVAELIYTLTISTD